jgi:hypothetical protein
MSKILREEVSKGMPGSGGMLDLFDMMVYTFYNITSDEYDVILENATDEELDDFVVAMGGLEENSTISEVKKGISVRNKYVEYYKPKQI